MEPVTPHLQPETLARLVDETPSPEELRHLSACAPCAEELEAFREQSRSLNGLPDLLPPTGDWEVLQAALVSEGLMEGGSGLLSMARTPGWMRVAVGVALFLVGTGVGAALTARPGTTAAGDAGAAGEGAFRFTAGESVSLDEAAGAVRLAERRYMDALVRYRQLSEAREGQPIPTPESRIAALEYLVQAGRAALREAPADPFLNGMVASAMAEREAALRFVSSEDGADWY